MGKEKKLLFLNILFLFFFFSYLSVFLESHGVAFGLILRNLKSQILENAVPND